MLAHRETERDASNHAIQITNRLTDSHLHLYTRTARERERGTESRRLLKTRHIQQTRSGMNKINHDKD